MHQLKHVNAALNLSYDEYYELILNDKQLIPKKKKKQYVLELKKNNKKVFTRLIFALRNERVYFFLQVVQVQFESITRSSVAN